MKICLVVADGPHKGKEIPIKFSQFVIGRDPQCQLRPASSMISRRHCAIHIRQGKIFLKDFGSTNGTLVNDKRVEGEIELKDKDQIKIDPLYFVLQVEASAPGKVVAPEPTGNSDDDSIAALLLGMGDEGSTGATLSESGVPEGSTVMQMQALPEGSPEPAADNEKSAADQKAAKAEKAKAEQGNTSNAAKLLLEKYSRKRRV
jgi:pSer/pThr/pTyr-binding forkhead associated (FHA) protein